MTSEKYSYKKYSKNNVIMISNNNPIYLILWILYTYVQGKLHKFCNPMPLFHASGLSIGALGPLIVKSTVYLPSAHFDPKATVDVLTKEKLANAFI